MSQHLPQLNQPLIQNGRFALDTAVYDIFRLIENSFRPEHNQQALEALFVLLDDFDNRCDQVQLYCVCSFFHNLSLLLLVSFFKPFIGIPQDYRKNQLDMRGLVEPPPVVTAPGAPLVNPEDRAVCSHLIFTVFSPLIFELTCGCRCCHTE